MSHMNESATQVIVVIPVYNHAGTLRDTVSRALEVHPRVLVVDDGSTDMDAGALVGGLQVPVVRHPINMGKGAAILTGAAEARRLGMSHMITMDADGQHDPRDIRLFLSLIDKDPYTILVGKRDLKGPNVPLGRRIGRGISNFWFRVLTGQKIGDAQSGFRSYPLAVIDGLKLRERGYALEMEALVKGVWAGVRLRDVEISVHYPPAEKRISHFRMLKDNIRLTILNFKLTLRSMVPIPYREIFPYQEGGEKITILHPIRSLTTLMSRDATPGRLAAAGALGVFLGALPLIAFHTVAILFTAGFFRLNKVTAVASSQLCMPPVVPALCIEAGYFLRHGSFLTEISFKTLGCHAVERIFEWLIGSLVLGPVLGLIVGGIIYVIGGLLIKGIFSESKVPGK